MLPELLLEPLLASLPLFLDTLLELLASLLLLLASLLLLLDSQQQLPLILELLLLTLLELQDSPLLFRHPELEAFPPSLLLEELPLTSLLVEHLLHSPHQPLSLHLCQDTPLKCPDTPHQSLEPSLPPHLCLLQFLDILDQLSLLLPLLQLLLDSLLLLQATLLLSHTLLPRPTLQERTIPTPSLSMIT